MEVTGVVFRPFPSITGGGGVTDVQSRSQSSSKPSLLGFSSRSRASSRVGCRGITKSCNSVLGLGFSDKAHLQYYYGGGGGGGGSATERRIRYAGAGIGNMEKLKEKEATKANKKIIKKRLKFLKGLSRDLSEFSELGFGLYPSGNGLLDQVKGQMISEATELLLGQLQQLKAEEKEIKRKKKEERDKLKASANMQKRVDCESSSSSSESSDSECGEVVNMNRLKTEALSVNERQPLMQQTIFTLPTQVSNTTIEMTEEVATSTAATSSTRCCNSLMVGGAYNGDGGGRSAVVVEAEKKKVGVCMGGKCKKSGGALLLEEFQKVLGVEAAVECKCMGKCRNAPNVRILEDDSISVRNVPTTNPLFIGVGFEDVNLIVANYFGRETNQELGLGLAAAF